MTKAFVHLDQNDLDMNASNGKYLEFELDFIQSDFYAALLQTKTVENS